MSENFTIPRPDLMPCPFCTGTPTVDRVLRHGYEKFLDDEDAYAYFVRCICCAAQGPWKKSESGAIQMWEMRGGKWKGSD